MEIRKTIRNAWNRVDPELRKGMVYSFWFHLGILLVVLIVSVTWTNRPLASPVYEVDLVSLPQTKPVSIKEPKKPKVAPPEKKKPPVKKVEAKKPPPPPKPTPPKPKKALPPPEPPAPKPVKPEPEPVKPEPPDEEAPQARAEPDPLAAIPVPEAQIQAEVEIPDFEYPYYLELIRKKIGQQWAPPPVNAGAELKEAVVVFTLFSKGKVTGIRIEKSSGNAFFDQAALRAIYQASPLPPLPQGVKEESLKIHFSFALVGKG